MAAHGGKNLILNLRPLALQTALGRLQRKGPVIFSRVFAATAFAETAADRIQT